MVMLDDNSGAAKDVVRYSEACDHCRGDIFPADGTWGDGWRCARCLCSWDLDFTLREAGSQCPIHKPTSAGAP